MNGNDYLLAFSELPEDLVRSASDDAAVRKAFRRHRSRRKQLLGALCCCIVVAAAAFGFGARKWFRQTPVGIPSETGIADHTMTQAPSSETPSAVSGFVPPETQAPSASSAQTPGAEQGRQSIPVRDETQNQPTQESESSPALSPAGVAVTEAAEGLFERSYRYALNGAVYSSYIPGRVIAPDKVGEKIEDSSATAGWKYADGTMPVTEKLRCEVYQIKNVDPETAICIRFLDQSEALTTDHYYVQLNALADLSTVSDYIISAEGSEGEE